MLLRMMRLCFAAILLSASALLAQSPEAAPGLHVPDGSRPWALDEFKGEAQMVPIHSSAVQTNNHKGSNVAGGLLAGPFYKAKFTTEIEGTQARTILHKATPVFYVRQQEAENGSSPFAGWAVVHVAVASDHRLLSTVKFTQLTGNAKRNDTQVEVVTEPLGDGWLRITPKDPLAPGEYALEPVLKQENAYSTMVYDFRVDPSAGDTSDAVRKSDQAGRVY
jgi:hypothetical protein